MPKRNRQALQAEGPVVDAQPQPAADYLLQTYKHTWLCLTDDGQLNHSATTKTEAIRLSVDERGNVTVAGQSLGLTQTKTPRLKLSCAPPVNIKLQDLGNGKVALQVCAGSAHSFASARGRGQLTSGTKQCRNYEKFTTHAVVPPVLGAANPHVGVNADAAAEEEGNNHAAAEEEGNLHLKIEMELFEQLKLRWNT